MLLDKNPIEPKRTKIQLLINVVLQDSAHQQSGSSQNQTGSTGNETGIEEYLGDGSKSKLRIITVSQNGVVYAKFIGGRQKSFLYQHATYQNFKINLLRSDGSTEKLNFTLTNTASQLEFSIELKGITFISSTQVRQNLQIAIHIGTRQGIY
ncbi:hypothetical protein FGO68_gene3527 [Halteria grandinella]|uniref:Uncharacterized protein n=1 Tax=Halteria grandinella TaxID=5974 RepID=A0A8J8P3C7_HALGN|nr:hypothetical protein FGO68_gene3527 [Halteria grandinella]